MNDFLNSFALRWGRIKYHWGKQGEIFPLHPWGLTGENIPLLSKAIDREEYALSIPGD